MRFEERKNDRKPKIKRGKQRRGKVKKTKIIVKKRARTKEGVLGSWEKKNMGEGRGEG